MTSYQRREQLIEIGRSLFASKGFEAVSVEEIAAVVRMLAGPEGGYITGQTIHVNGGVFLT